MTITPPNNTGKILTKRLLTANGTAVTLNYSRPEAEAMRRLVQSINLEGDRKPSLSLLARRSMTLYLSGLVRAKVDMPHLFAEEVAALDRMVTPIPQPDPRDKLKRKP